MKPMIYLAARYSRNDEMRGVRDVLQALGFIVTSRWIDLHPDVVGDFSESFTADMLNTDAEKCAPLGQHDLDDIDRAEWVVSFTGEGGKGGRHIEFGYGLARNKRMIVIGPRENVFHALPSVMVFETWYHFVVWLAGEYWRVDVPTSAVRSHSMSGVKLTYAIEMLRGLIATMEQHAPMSVDLEQASHVVEVPHPTRVHRKLAGLAAFSMTVRFAPGTAEWVRAELVADQEAE